MRQKQGLKPEIGKPGLPTWAKFAAGGVIAVCATGALVAGLVHLEAEGREERRADFIQQMEIPSGFFAQRPEPAPEPEPEPEPAPVQVVQQAPPPPPPAPAPVVIRAPLFEVDRESAEERELRRIREQINLRRRQSGGVRVALVNTTKEQVEYDAEDEDWSEYGIPEEEASFPRDMSRLITQDRMIRAVLVNEINSELPGQVVAQVEEPVYGAHGRNVLVPAGSRAIGQYKPLQRIGEERLAIFWTRIITPDGINITLEDGQGVDQMGRSGVGGDLDRRYGERYGVTMLFSLVSTAMQVAVQSQTDQQGNQYIVNSMSRDTSDIASMILQDHLNIKPRLTVAAGTRILIQPSRDIVFQKPVRRIVRVTEAGEQS